MATLALLLRSTSWTHTPSTYRFLRAVVTVALAFASVWSPSAAHACDATNPEVHQGNHITWCADPTFWAEHSAAVTPFFAYADRIVPQLTQDFGFPVEANFTIVVTQPTGYASTPTAYGPGVNITGDAFYNEAFGVPGFNGYLLLLHEFVNQWTGLANGGAGGWPTDWWANHRSPFPNAIDGIVLAELGQPAAAQAQIARWLPGGGSPDPQVPLFTKLFEDFGGWPFLRRYFALIRTDGVQWPQLRDPPTFMAQSQFVSGNPSPLLANYVAAYFNLATGVDVQARFAAAGVGSAPPNWEGPPAFVPYALEAESMAGIAVAHCRMQNADPDTVHAANARARYKLGDFAGANRLLNNDAACTQRCVGVCACDKIKGVCLPAYLVADARGEDSGLDSASSADGNAGSSTPDSTASELAPQGCSGCATQSPAAGAASIAMGLLGLSWRYCHRALRRAKTVR